MTTPASSGMRSSSATISWSPPRLPVARRRACSTRIQRIALADAAKKWLRSLADSGAPRLMRRNSSCTSTVGVIVASPPSIRELASRRSSGYRASKTAPIRSGSPSRASASRRVMSSFSGIPGDASSDAGGRQAGKRPYNHAMRDAVDILVIGGGHNGLVCAAYLAAAGLKVRVLERRGVVGGAAVTEEFHPGFRNSLASYTVSLLNPRVIRDLRLVEHGLRIVERPYANFLPLPDGRAFRFGGEHTQAEVATWSLRAAERLPAYFAMLERVVAVLRELMLRTPPNVSDRVVLADWIASLAVGRELRKLDMAARRDLLDLFTRSAGDLLDAWRESEPLKAVPGSGSGGAHPSTP